jgi:hypothetical protein
MKTNCLHPFHKIQILENGDYRSCCHQDILYGNIFDKNFSWETYSDLVILKKIKSECSNNSLHRVCNNHRCPVFYRKESNMEVSEYEVPIDIEFSLPATWCNIGGFEPTHTTACIMCPRSSKTFYKDTYTGDNTDKIVEKITPLIPTLKTLSILGLAEPFFHGKLFDVFDKLNYKEHKDHIHFWTATNMIPFIEKFQDKFFEYTNSHHLILSIDGATRETYKKIRKLDMLDIVWKHTEEYFKKVYKYNRGVGSHINMNVNKLNLNEMPELIKKANDIGVPLIQFSLTHETSGTTVMDLNKHLLCNESNWEEFWEMQQYCLQYAESLDVNLEFYVDFHKGFLK